MPSTKHARTIDDLIGDLRGPCRVHAGDIVIVHSSVTSVGPLEGGVDTLLEALLRTVSPEGTLLMPVFSHPQPEGVFDVKTTSSRTGLLTETFRRLDGTLRSLHPTHSVAAWGRRAKELVVGHENTSGLGLGSPFHRASEAGASVLMVGCPITTCSLVHVAEAMVRPPYFGEVVYPGYDRILTVVDRDGVRHEVTPFDVPTDSQGFPVVQHELERRGVLHECRLGKAMTMRFVGRDCLDATEDLLRADPAALLCDRVGCEVCPRAREIIAVHRTSSEER